MPLTTVTATDSVAFGDAVIAGKPGSLQTPPVFPLGMAATKDLLSFFNTFPSDVIATLASGISDTDLSLSVSTGAGDQQFPTDNFEVSIDDEILFIATRSGDTLTIGYRGAENTTPAAHLIGATVELLITALSHNQVAAEIVMIEQLLGTKGGHFYPTEVALAPGAGGDFTVAHGLGVIPRFALIQMTSGGLIYFQSATRYDATNLYLTASDAGVTGVALVWS